MAGITAAVDVPIFTELNAVEVPLMVGTRPADFLC
jgi:hypothetical protein